MAVDDESSDDCGPALGRRAFVAALAAPVVGAAVAGCGQRYERGSGAQLAAEPASGAIERIAVDARAPIGPYARLSGVQGSPYPLVAEDTDHTEPFRSFEIQHARIDQDCPANTLTLGGIFPDATADPDRPESYDFRAIDRHIAAARAAGATVLWQSSYDIGRSDRWQGLNLGGRPPHDLDRWSRVLRRCLEHFNLGWAGGLDHAVANVEFLNEPTGLGGFNGDEGARLLPVFERFLDTVTSYNRDHPDAPVRAVGPGIPLCYAEYPDWEPRFDRALAALAGGGRTIPVFSFHTYGSDTSPVANARLAHAFRALLDRHGMRSTELWNTEWQAGEFLLQHLLAGRERPAAPTDAQLSSWAMAAATYALACKTRWQGVLSGSYYYRVNRRAFAPGAAPPIRYDERGRGGFFSPSGQIGALALHEQLTARIASLVPERCGTTFHDDGLFTALGVRTSDARRVGVLVCNLATRSRQLDVRVRGLAASPRAASRSLWIDVEHARIAERSLDVTRSSTGELVVRATVAPLASELILVELGV